MLAGGLEKNIKNNLISQPKKNRCVMVTENDFIKVIFKKTFIQAINNCYGES